MKKAFLIRCPHAGTMGWKRHITSDGLGPLCNGKCKTGWVVDDLTIKQADEGNYLCEKCKARLKELKITSQQGPPAS